MKLQAGIGLRVVVFVSGACVLALEIIALRLLEPYFGTTLYSISSVLSVVLLALAVGYAAGGWLAGAYPSKSGFYRIVSFAGYAVLIIVLLRDHALPYIAQQLPISYGPLLVSALLFFLPNFLLGLLSPYAIEIESRVREERAGRIAGNLFFWSTFGSLFGSLLVGFLLIPHLGIRTVLLGIGFLLALLGLAARLFRVRYEILICILVSASVFIFRPMLQNSGIIYAHDGTYESIEVHDTSYRGHPARFLSLGGAVAAGELLDSKDLAFDYTAYYRLYRVLHPNVQHALVIGAGAYTVPKALVAELPQAEVDAADIEPDLLPIAQTYFGLADTSRIHTHIIDGRSMLEKGTTRYDFIYSDVYYTLYSVPPHLTTLEFLTKAHQSLTPGGIFMANVIGTLQQGEPSLIFSEMRTFQAAFPNSYFFAVDSPDSLTIQNVMFVGLATSTPINWSDASIASNINPTIRDASKHLIDTSKYDLNSYPILTDDYSPTEYLTAQMFRASEPAKDFFF